MNIFLRDLARKAEWHFGKSDPRSLLRAFFSDGTCEMFIYRLMWLFDKQRLVPLVLFFAWFNGALNKIVIGRHADFGPGFVILHSCGVVINSAVKGGKNIVIENGVTIGARENQSPKLGDNIYIGAGAKIIGGVTIGDNVKVGANAVVTKDVPSDCTVVGIPAKIVRLKGERVELPL